MTRTKPHTLIVLLITAGWALAGTALAVLVIYIPGALDIVDDHALGRGAALILLPSLVLMAAAGLCAGLRRYVLAAALTTLVLLGCAALDAMIIMRALGA